MYGQCVIPVALVYILFCCFSQGGTSASKFSRFRIRLYYASLIIEIFAHSVWCVSAGLDPKIFEAVGFLLILVF